MAEAAAADNLEVPEVVYFSVGDCFKSSDALQTKIKAYERAHFVQFWRRDLRTIEAAKKPLDRLLNPALKYLIQVKILLYSWRLKLETEGEGAEHYFISLILNKLYFAINRSSIRISTDLNATVQ